MTDRIPYWLSSKCTLKKRGIAPIFTHISENVIEEIIKMYSTGNYNYKEIATHFNRQLSSIARLLNRKGFKAKSASVLSRKYNVNDNYFDVIDTEGKAYYLGFLFADGYNNSRNNSITVSLQSEDEEILTTFLKELNSNHPIKKYNEKNHSYSQIRIGNKILSGMLSKHGCVQNKTFKIAKCEVSQHLIHHFIRGYFDGDGGFYMSKTIKSNMRISITSNKIFLSYIQDILIGALGLNKTRIGDSSNSNDKIGTLDYSGRNSCIKIRDWMYRDATIYLKRKFDKLNSI